MLHRSDIRIALLVQALSLEIERGALIIREQNLTFGLVGPDVFVEGSEVALEFIDKLVIRILHQRPPELMLLPVVIHVENLTFPVVLLPEGTGGQNIIKIVACLNVLECLIGT